MSVTLPDTFRSEHALADAVDAVFADALAEELAAAFTATAIELPPSDALIAQAGIIAGPCPPDPQTPSRSVRAARSGLTLAGRAAWWLVKGAAFVTALLLVQTVRAAWHLTVPSAPAAAPTSPALRPSQFLATTSDEIHRRGWTQGRLADSGGVCVLGAQTALLQRGIGDADVADRSCTYLLAAVQRKSVPAWNDGLARREEHIHAALYRAAARARAAGD